MTSFFMDYVVKLLNHSSCRFSNVVDYNMSSGNGIWIWLPGQFVMAQRLANYLIDISGKRMKNREDSEVIELREEVQDDEESFGDLGEGNAAMQEELGRRIIIEQDTMESNDLLIDPKFCAPKEPPTVSLPSAPSSPPQSQGEREERDNFYKGLLSKLEEYSYNDQTLQPSYTHFEAEERKYLEQVKVLYCHFLIGDRILSPQQYRQLRALLYVPKYGERLLKWGNSKYEFALTMTLALQRLDLLEKTSLQPKSRCREDTRLLVMLVLLLIVIKLLS